MNAEVRLVHDMSFVGKAESGHWVAMDAAEKVGGGNSASRPLELLLIGVGGCTGLDVVSILRKKRVPFTELWIEVEAPQAPDYPKVFTEITITYHVAGQGVKEADVARAVELSQEKYCSVSAMLRKAAPIVTKIQIHEGGGK
jgi:putative redox protein